MFKRIACIRKIYVLTGLIPFHKPNTVSLRMTVAKVPTVLGLTTALQIKEKKS